MADFTMPALGADMETAKVVQWHVKRGDRVKSGDIVAVVETHKGAIDVECFLEGFIDELAPLNVEIPVGARLATIYPTVEAEPPSSTPNTQPESAAKPSLLDFPSVQPDPISVVSALTLPDERIRAAPAARHEASRLGIALKDVQRKANCDTVTLHDIQRVASGPQPSSSPAAKRPTNRPGFDPEQMRQAIAAAMSRSKREIPHYYLSSTIDFFAAQSWLDAWNAVHAPIDRMLPAALLLKSIATALAKVPQLNGFYENNQCRLSPDIHIGWAVALRGGGLVAPAIHNADRLAMPTLMVALRDLVQRARSGGLRSSELTDPTITVTSLGERGAESVWGVIYPPQLAIVGFGRVVQRPWVVQEGIVTRPVVNVSLAADHRASDGHLGGQLLRAIDTALQYPESL